MLYIGAVVCILVMFLGIFLLFFGLPGTWIIILAAGIFAFFTDAPDLTWQLFAMLAGLAIVGEVAEFMAGHYGTKKYGGSTKGSLGGMVGALVGAILCAPLFFGLGALLGALGGAFAGCFCVEVLRGVAGKKAARVAWGTTLGRFGGFIIKLGIAIVLLYYSIPPIWSAAGM